MTQASPFTSDLTVHNQDVDLSFQLPDPDDEQISEADFQRQVEAAWLVCDRFDLQTDIWRGRILRTVRDREKRGGDGRGTGFLNWLKDREISKSQAYALIELANSADTLLENGMLETQDVNQFSKRAFVETAQSAPEVQQLVSEAAHRGEHITRREVKQLADEWTAMTSDLIPEEVREKAANNTIPVRYLAPLVREMEKLPESHQETLKTEVTINPNVDTLKQVTAEARYLSKYLEAAVQVQALDQESLDLEQALEQAHAGIVTQQEALAGLRPVFRKEGSVTAGNASGINDGAAALVMMRLSEAERRGLKPLAKITATAAHAHEPAYFTTAPVPAMRKVLEKAGWQTKDVDLWEINEAFAVVPMIAMKELGLSHDVINIHGGACALGHPIGASGARIMTTLISAMEQKDVKKGVASLCIGGGEGTAMALELI